VFIVNRGTQTERHCI